MVTEFFFFSQVRVSRQACSRVNIRYYQFKLALDIIEDFLVGEGYKFLRLVITLVFSSMSLATDMTLSRMGT